MSNAEPAEPTTATPLPYLRLIVALQCVAIGVSALGFFASLLVAPIHYSALGGVLGVNGVWMYSVALAFFMAQFIFVRAYVGDGTATDRWARFALFCMFLVCINAFAIGARGLIHWGIVAGHDEPQYYAYLHSWFFDRDVDFENELKRIDGAWELMSEAHPERPEYNVAPIGTAVVWIPVYAVAHIVLLALRAAGVDVPADGISTPYAFACALGSSLCVLLGMLIIHATLRRWFSQRAAFLATVLLWVASPIIWYQTDQPWMSHAASFFTAALVLWFWARTLEQRSLAGYALLGCAIGLAMLVRPTHAVLLLLPIADIVRARDRRGRNAAGALISGACTGLVYSAQLAVWAARYNWLEQGINTPPGSPMAWARPAISQVLFSAHHGLFAWHPVLVFGFVGLLLFWRRSRHVAVCLALLLVAYVYANAAIDSWHGGGSFGMRRFVGVLPFMAPGIAAFGVWFVHFCRKHYLVPVTAVVASLFLYNVLLITQLRAGWTPFRRPASFQQVWTASSTIFHDWFGNPFSYPANLAFAYRHGVSPSQYDVMGGMPFSPDIAVQGPAIRPFLGTGWQTDYAYAYRLNGGFAAQQRHNELLLYMHKGHAYDIKLLLSLSSQRKEPMNASFAINGRTMGKATLEPGAKSELKLFVPGDASVEGLNVMSVDFEDITPVFRTGSRGEGGGHGLELPTRKPYNIAGFIWKLEVATHYDTPQEQPATQPSDTESILEKTQG